MADQSMIVRDALLGAPLHDARRLAVEVRNGDGVPTATAEFAAGGQGASRNPGSVTIVVDRSYVGCSKDVREPGDDLIVVHRNAAGKRDGFGAVLLAYRQHLLGNELDRL